MNLALMVYNIRNIVLAYTTVTTLVQYQLHPPLWAFTRQSHCIVFSCVLGYILHMTEADVACVADMTTGGVTCHNLPRQISVTP